VKLLIFHPEAEEELDAAVAYYEGKRKGVGLEFRDEVEAAVQVIQQSPKLRPTYKNTNYRKSVLKRFPFTIFYLEREEEIWICAVAHQKRRPGYWQSRIPE
jgi:toxin ParE1/3/4